MVTRARKPKITIATSQFEEDGSRPEEANEVARRGFVRNTFPLCARSRAHWESRCYCAEQILQQAKDMGLSEDDVRMILTEYDREQSDPEERVYHILFGSAARRGREAIVGLLS